MRSTMRTWAKLAAIAALAAGAVFTAAQDWRAYGGDNQRTGHNAPPAAVSGPGRSFLRWWRPNANDAVGGSYVIDNLSLLINGNPYQTLFTGVWGAPATVGEEAENPFIPGAYINADPTANPAYRWSFTTASNFSGDPTQPQIAAQHATAEWQLDFAGFGDNTPRGYALYVWLPIGSTISGGNRFFTQRYFVYEIFYGNGQRWVDVVDTYAAGTGWVRLGGGGRATSQLFQFDGTNPIRIVLHNTIPRDSGGALADQPGTTMVYADAVRAISDIGAYRASPIVSEFGAGGPLSTHTVAARNRTSTGLRNNELVTVTTGQVISYQFDSSLGTNNTRWIYEPVSLSEDTTFMDDASAGVTINPAWTSQNVPATFYGVDYHSAPITNVLGTETDVAYAPTLEDGNYEVWAWLPGSAGGVNFGQAVMAEIREGSAVTQVTVDQDNARGWVRLGTRRFAHTQADPLTVHLTNYSADPLDAGRVAYADAVRFVGGTNLAINSTPVQADVLIRTSPGGPLVQTSVTFAAAENGRIYALDSQGNGDGTTTCYWTYPSTPDPNNPAWTDPNQVVGQDGNGPIAEMPTGFDLSSALVQRINGEDYLFIGASNGRVYCIAVAGRGDMNAALQIPGTTNRVWSFPDDYPGRTLRSTLGPITGSIAYAEVNPGEHRIFIPTTTGRMYCVDAVGNAARKSTSVIWQFPAANVQPPGAIVGTPAIAFGNIYYGTQVGTGDDRGRFYALNAATGAIVWQYNNEPFWSANGDLQRADDFNSGPVTIPASEMVGMPDTVVVANDNRWITALDATTGAMLWTTDELAGTVIGNLSFTHQMVYNNAGALASAPVVLVPLADGRIASLFAETFRTNVFGGYSRLAWGFETEGGLTSQVSVGRNWMYAADDNGYIYAFNDTAGAISPGNPPGQSVIPPNDPQGLPFREAQIRFVTKDTYERLRLQTGNGGHLNYGQATAAARTVSTTGFEWGETVYALVFNIPYSLSANPVPPGLPAQVNYRFSTEGASIRNVTVTAKQFSAPGTAPVSAITGERLDGYAITSFTIQGSGSTALPPGNALATFTVSAQFAPGARFQNVALNPATTRRQFAIANPIGVVVGFNSPNTPDPMRSIGYDVNPDFPENMVNGSPDLGATPGKREDLLLSSIGAVSHGQPGNSLIALVDRSLMTLLRGPGRGLDQVRALRSEMAWQGGAVAVNNWNKPIDQFRYPFTEDLPVNFPNTSLDYPNLSREYISIVKDKFGNVENPLYNGVSLIAPTDAGGGPVDPNTPLNRTLPLTPVDFEVAVPRYQPPNLSLMPTSVVGNTLPGGYYGRIDFFVDSSGNGQLDRRGRREAFRSMFLGGSVTVDQRIVVETPTVDLGSLAQGTGYSPLSPGGNDFSPWVGLPQFQSIYKPFVVKNEGNVNLLNLRLAKASNVGGAYTSWGLFAPANHERSWLDTTLSLWSDIDATYALPFGGSNAVLGQKARVGDRSGAVVTTNPIRRANPNLDPPNGVGQGAVNAAGPEPASPRVAVSIPIGSPVGTYVTTLRVIEDDNQDESMAVDAAGNSLEPYSDPTFVLRFNVREARITNGHTNRTAPMVHGTLSGAESFLYKNVQPTAFRTPLGETVVAYASNAAAFNDPQPTDAIDNDRWRLYFATLTGTSVPASPAGTNPLRDLYGWSPAGARWFNQSTGPFPVSPDDVNFSAQPGETVLPNTVKYGAPNFPVTGGYNPLTNTFSPFTYVAYLGIAEKQAASGRSHETRIMLNRVSTDDSGNTTIEGQAGSGDRRPWVLPYDVTVSKGRPAIVQAGNTATVFYPGGGTGSNALYHTFFEGDAFTQPQPLNLGNGFESIVNPSATLRTYSGVSLNGITTGTPIIEMAFVGKLRSREHAEVYFARLRSDSSGRVMNIPGQRTPLALLPRQTRERLVATGDGSTFHSAGLLWNTSNPGGDPIVLEQRIGASITDLEVPNTRKVDQPTGLISFDCTLGGKAYLDPSLGTVRFTGAVPARNATLMLSYSARILRISTSGGAAYASPTTLFDNRLIGEFSYWANQINGPIAPDDAVRSGRFVFTYGRAAAGAGAASRPYMRTMRLGVQLPTAISTQPNGNVTSMVVTGLAPGSFYQVDPANGRVYFTAENEGRVVNVSYTSVDETTGAPGPILAADYTVALIGERAEAPVPIEQAVNETQLFSFLDMVEPSALSASQRRPGLIWMVFTSTRAGGPDVYIQTIAPRLTPVATNRG